MENKTFADGIMFRLPSEKSPKWIKGNISVNVAKFTDFLNKVSNERGWVNLDVKDSKNGTMYIELNTYQKPQNAPTNENNPKADELPY